MVPLTMHHLLWRIRAVNPESEVVTVMSGGEPTRRCTFEQLAWRIEALAHGLRDKTGLATGETVTVLSWNDQYHLELLMAVPLTGARVNSVNVRLGGETLTYLATNPLPRVLVVNEELYEHPAVGSEILALVRHLLDSGVTVVTISQDPHASNASISYERLIEDNLGRRWEDSVTDENSTAFVFHSSGTTGMPKSYQVSHRAVMLHCLSQATVDAAGVSRKDRVLPLAPFFHVNGWGLPLTCLLTGASLILTGGDLEPERIARILESQNVTVAAGVPTVWHDICAAVVRCELERPTELREVLTGGSLVPKPVWQAIRGTLGAEVAAAWGMTETMACSTYERERPHERAGKPIPLVEIMVEDNELGPSSLVGPSGRLKVRGPFVIGNNLPDPSSWFTTGDIATLDATGFLTLHDRENDLIKSGGEWIASAEIEQHLCTHPAVESAVVVPMSHPKWIERPLAYVVRSQASQGDTNLEQSLTAYIAVKFPRWWVPDEIMFLDEMPITATGKIDKKTLRKISINEKV